MQLTLPMIWMALIIAGPPNVMLVDPTRLYGQNELINPSSVIQIVWSAAIILSALMFKTSLNCSKLNSSMIRGATGSLFVIGIGVIISAIIVSQVYSISPMISGYRAIEVVVVVALMIRHRQVLATKDRLWNILVVAGLIRCLFIVPITIWSPEIGGIGTMSYYRFAGQIYGPNGNGILFAIVSLLSLDLIFRMPRDKLPYVVFVVSVALLLLTRSRTATIVAICGILLLVCSSKLMTRPKVIGMLFAGLIGLIVSIDPEKYIGAGQTGDAALNSVLTLSERTLAWDAAITAISERPIVGYGFIAGQRGLDDYVDAEAQWIPGHAHNDFLQAWLCLGFMGVLSVFLFYFIVIRLCARPLLSGNVEGLRLLGPCLLISFMSYGMMTPFLVAPLQASGALGWAMLIFLLNGGLLSRQGSDIPYVGYGLGAQTTSTARTSINCR